MMMSKEKKKTEVGAFNNRSILQCSETISCEHALVLHW